MTPIAASALAGLLPVLLILACPLMMIFMMRGMHGGRGHGHGHAGHGAGGGCHGGGADEPTESRPSRAAMSLDELKRERDELNVLIGERAEEAVASRR